MPGPRAAPVWLAAPARRGLLGKIIGEMPLVGWRPVHIIEVGISGNSRIDCLAQVIGRGEAVETQLQRARRRRRDRDQEIVVGMYATRSDQQSGRSSKLGERSAPQRKAPGKGARRQMDVAKQFAR